MTDTINVTMKRERLLMDQGWRFHRGEIPFPEAKIHGEAYNWGWSKTGAFKGAADARFDDSAWRNVDLPHDWVVEGALTQRRTPPGVLFRWCGLVPENLLPPGFGRGAETIFRVRRRVPRCHHISEWTPQRS